MSPVVHVQQHRAGHVVDFALDLLVSYFKLVSTFVGVRKVIIWVTSAIGSFTEYGSESSAGCRLDLCMHVTCNGIV